MTHSVSKQYMGYLSQQTDVPPPRLHQVLGPGEAGHPCHQQRKSFGDFGIFGIYTHSLISCFHWLNCVSKIGAFLTSWVPPGSSGHYLECSAWCLCDPVLSLWPSQYLSFSLCVFHSNHLLGGPYAFANRKTKDPRAQLCILITKLCFWVSVSTASAPCAGLRALCLSCVSLSTPTASKSASLGNPMQYYMFVRWQDVQLRKAGRIFSELQAVCKFSHKNVGVYDLSAT